MSRSHRSQQWCSPHTHDPRKRDQTGTFLFGAVISLAAIGFAVYITGSVLLALAAIALLVIVVGFVIWGHRGAHIKEYHVGDEQEIPTKPEVSYSELENYAGFDVNEVQRIHERIDNLHVRVDNTDRRLDQVAEDAHTALDAWSDNAITELSGEND